MIVCVCKNISDHAIGHARQAGHTSFEDIQIELGAATCCGKCEPAVRDALCIAAAVQRIHVYPKARPAAHAIAHLLPHTLAQLPPYATAIASHATHSVSPFARTLRAQVFAGAHAAG